jgi:hypothetical protein
MEVLKLKIDNKLSKDLIMIPEYYALLVQQDLEVLA